MVILLRETQFSNSLSPMNVIDGGIVISTKPESLNAFGPIAVIDYSQDNKLGENDVGRISLQFNVLRNGSNSDDAERTPFKIGESIKGTIVLANVLPKTNSNGSDTYCVLSIFSRMTKIKKIKLKLVLSIARKILFGIKVLILHV